MHEFQISVEVADGVNQKPSLIVFIKTELKWYILQKFNNGQNGVRGDVIVVSLNIDLNHEISHVAVQMGFF